MPEMKQGYSFSDGEGCDGCIAESAAPDATVQNHASPKTRTSSFREHQLSWVRSLRPSTLFVGPLGDHCGPQILMPSVHC